MMDQNAINMLLAGQQGGGGGGRRMTVFKSADAIEWQSFRITFENVSRLKNWNDNARLLNLSAALEGDAARRARTIDINQLHPQTGLPWTSAQLLEAYDRLFLPPGSGELARTLFKEAYQQTGESIVAWHTRICELFLRAHPHEDFEVSRELLEAFIYRLHSRELRKLVAVAAPRTFSAAKDLATEQAAYLHRLDREEMNLKAATTRGSGAGGINAISITSAETGQSSGNPGEVQAMTKVDCFYCRRVGHYKRDCKTLMRDIANGKVTSEDAAGYSRKDAAGTGRGRNGVQKRGRGQRRNQGGRGGGRRGNDRRSDTIASISRSLQELTAALGDESDTGFDGGAGTGSEN